MRMLLTPAKNRAHRATGLRTAAPPFVSPTTTASERSHICDNAAPFESSFNVNAETRPPGMGGWRDLFCIRFARGGAREPRRFSAGAAPAASASLEKIFLQAPRGLLVFVAVAGGQRQSEGPEISSCLLRRSHCGPEPRL